MKKILLASAAVLAMSATAQAADIITMPAPSEPYVAPMAAPQQFDWSGAYVGGTGGYAWGKSSMVDKSSGLKISSDSFDGAKIGGFAGYNYQFDNNFVLGVEGEADYNFNENKFKATPAFKRLVPAVKSMTLGNDWEGSARVRAGYAFDNVLLYATGGVAMTNSYLKVAKNTVIDNIATSKSSNHNTFRTGWTAGAGIDYAFTDKLFGGLEYRYTDYGTTNLKKGMDGTKSKDFTSNSVMARIGYKF